MELLSHLKYHIPSELFEHTPQCVGTFMPGHDRIHSDGGCTMYKVMIVDDEKPARELLKMALDWEKAGFRDGSG